MVYTETARGKENARSLDMKDGNYAYGKENLRISYTNIDGLLSSILEVRDYLREESRCDVSNRN